MIDKICDFLTRLIRKEMPEIDDERAEVINYGLQNIVGEIPKIFLMLGVSFLLGIFKEALITFLVLFLYKGASGGFHAKTHLGCILSTCGIYCGIALAAKYIILAEIVKYILIGITFIFGIIMIKKYAPADTENVPILNKQDRKRKKIMSYIFLTIAMICALFIQDSTLANIIIFGHLVQTITITRFVYKLTKNKYGYEVYGDTSNQTV